MKESAPKSDRVAQGIIVLVDVVLLTLLDSGLGVLVHKRASDPFAGWDALPGGYIQPSLDASPEDAARRVLLDKVGVKVPFLEQLASYGSPTRDPGGWSVSIAYVALVPNTTPDMTWAPVEGIRRVAFDHRQIIKDAVERVRRRSAYSALPAHLAGKQFTLPQLQRVYELVLGESIDKVSFRRRMTEIGAIEPVEGAFESGRGRSAQIYQLSRKERIRNNVLERGLGTRA